MLAIIIMMAEIMVIMLIIEIIAFRIDLLSSK